MKKTSKRRYRSIDCSVDAQAYADEHPSKNPLNQLAQLVHKLAKEKGWWTGKKGAPEGKLLMMHTEIAEITEEYRRGRPMTEIRWEKDEHGQVKPEGVPVEAADLAIRLLDFCAKHKIDLARAIEIKHTFNSGRPYLHGGKKI